MPILLPALYWSKSGYNFAIVRIYIGAIVLLLGLSIFVSLEDQKASKDCGQPTVQRSRAPIAEETDQQHPQERAGNPCPSPPSWHYFFAWPGGITVWAIILTLVAVAHQTRETARSAGAAQRGIGLQFRPKLRVRHVLLAGDPAHSVQFTLINVGGNSLRFDKVDILVSYRAGAYYGDRRNKGSSNPAPAEYEEEFDISDWGTLEAGASMERTIALNDAGRQRIAYLIQAEKMGTTNPHLVGYMQAAGTLRYLDALKISRETGIHRILQLPSRRALTPEASEHEYED